MKPSRRFVPIAAATLLALLIIISFGSRQSPKKEKPPTVAWGKQFGTDGDDLIECVAADEKSDLYVLSLQVEPGGYIYDYKSLIHRYDKNGRECWAFPIGDKGSACQTLVYDGNGCLYIGGLSAKGSRKHHIPPDMLLAKIKCHNGAIKLKAVSDPQGQPCDCDDLAIDESGDLKALLSVPDHAILTLDPQMRQTRLTRIVTQGISGDKDFPECFSMAKQGNMYYIAGHSVPTDSLESRGFIYKLDSKGHLVWERHIEQEVREIATDDKGFIYITGSVCPGYQDKGNSGPIAKRIFRWWNNRRIKRRRQIEGESDGYVAKYDSSGRRLWLSQLRTKESDLLQGIAADKEGNVYAVGISNLQNGPITNQVRQQGLIVKYDSDGRQLWRKKIGEGVGAELHAVAVTDQGAIYVGGYTVGSLYNEFEGITDAILIKLKQ